jgi:hypothetical protein
LRRRYVTERSRTVNEEIKMLLASRKATVEGTRPLHNSNPKLASEHRAKISYMTHELVRLQAERKALEEERERLQSQPADSSKIPPRD